MAFPTNPIYKLIKEPIRNEITGVFKYRGTMLLSIPIDEANIDYQDYLKWKADGGVPEEAD
jgi:hypothetical protein